MQYAAVCIPLFFGEFVVCTGMHNGCTGCRNKKAGIQNGLNLKNNSTFFFRFTQLISSLPVNFPENVKPTAAAFCRVFAKAENKQ